MFLSWNPKERALESNDYTCLRVIQESSSVLSRTRSAKAVTEPKIDLGRARDWLDHCLNNHKECGVSTLSELTTLRLINVVTGCVEEVKMPCKYVALSYVWGGASSIKLTTRNQMAMSRPGVLTEVWERIPRTIKDAIKAVQELSEEYLWVDTLCLLQNDSGDIKNGIAVMDLIYERAILTIIAASGGHANAGLPGVGSTRRSVSQQIELIKPGIRLACHLDLDNLLRHTVYNQRGWT